MGSRQSGHYPYVKDVQGMSIWEFTMFHGHLRRLKVTCLGSLWDGTVLSGLLVSPAHSLMPSGLLCFSQLLQIKNMMTVMTNHIFLNRTYQRRVW